jgi:hypothetical protein
MMPPTLELAPAVVFRGFRDPGLNVAFRQDALCFVADSPILRSEHLFLYKQVSTRSWAISTPSSDRAGTSRNDMLLDAQSGGEHGFAVEQGEGCWFEFSDGAWSVSPGVCFAVADMAVGGAPSPTTWFQRRGLTKVLNDYIASRVLAPRITRTKAPPLPPPLGGVLPPLGPPPLPRRPGPPPVPRRLAMRPEMLRFPFAEPAEPVDPSLQEARPRSSSKAAAEHDRQEPNPNPRRSSAPSSRDSAVDARGTQVEEGEIPEDSHSDEPGADEPRVDPANWQRPF